MGLKFRKPEKRSNFGVDFASWIELAISSSSSYEQEEDAHFLRRRHLKLDLYNHIYSVSLLDFFVKLKDVCYKEER